MTETRNISFADKDVLKYIDRLALIHFPNGDSGNLSAAVSECIRCHQYVTRSYPDWRNIQQLPEVIADRIIDRLKDHITFDGHEQEMKEEIKRSFEIDEGNLFE